MATSSVPAVVDYLIAQANVVAAAQTTKTIVSDGYLAGEAAQWFAVGVTDKDDTVDVRLKFGALGAKSSSEEFDIRCAIYAAGGSSQKTYRDAVYAIFNAFITVILADPSLGGTLGPSAGAGVASINAERLQQTRKPNEASQGREARLYFDVHCVAYFPPTA